MCWPTSTAPAPPTDLPRRSMDDWNTCAARPSGSATSPTTSHDRSSRPADSDPTYTLDPDEPLIGDEDHAVPLPASSSHPPLDVKAEEVDPFAQVPDPGLGLGQPQPDLGQHFGGLFFQSEHVIAAAVGHDDEVVRVAHDPPVTQPVIAALGSTSLG